jgi:hypothetical protein
MENRLRKLYAGIILVCLVYFIGGSIALKFDLVTRDEYFAYAGIVGSLATVAGLLALTRPAITQSDIKSIELETLKSVADTADQLHQLQTARAKTVQEIDGLAVKKKEMELLVKKASLALFLKEQYFYHERKILDEVSKNEALTLALQNAGEAADKISALDEEIAVDPNVQQLRDIIATASRKEPTFEEALNNLPPVTRTLFLASRTLNRALVDAFQTVFK